MTDNSEQNAPIDPAVLARLKMLAASSIVGSDIKLALAEIDRLNKWADSFSDRQLEERRTAEAYQRELQEEIKRLDADAANEKAEKESLAAIVRTRDEEIERLTHELSHVQNLIDFTAPLSCATHGLFLNLALFDNKCPACVLDEARNALSTARHAGTVAAAARDKFRIALERLEPEVSPRGMAIILSVLAESGAPRREAEVSRQSFYAWRPIETAPQDGAPVLVATENGVGEAEWYGERDGWWWVNNAPTDSWGNRIYPTHWIPLPPPPESFSEGER